MQLNTSFGDFTVWKGVPNAWGFLMFCAVWTVLGSIFLLLAGRLQESIWVGYTCVGVEVVALLSWLAGFVAVAVNVGSSICPREENNCGAIKAATVFGALEFVLFAVTAARTWKPVFGTPRWKGPAAKIGRAHV